MSDNVIKVRTEELVRKAGTVKLKVKAMQKAVDEAQELVSSTSYYWIGDAGDKKRKDFIKLKEEADKVFNRLREYPDDLLQMAGLYVASENTNTQKAEGLPTDVIK